MLEIHLTQAPDLLLTHTGATTEEQGVGVSLACNGKLGLWDIVASGWNSGSAIYKVCDFKQVT